MSCSPEISKDDHKNSNDPDIIQLGFNISLAGKSASDFEIYVNDKKQASGQLSAANLKQISLSADQANWEMASNSKSAQGKFTDGLCKNKISKLKDASVEEAHLQKNEEDPLASEVHDKMSRNEDLTIVDEIKSAMGNFEKFSEHIREIPRLSTRQVHTSTPYPDKRNSRSEGNLSLYGNPRKSFVPKHDFRDRKYFRKPRTLTSDLFLKPLPAEDYFKRAFIRRYYDVESYHQYSSVDSLPQYCEYGAEYKVLEKNTANSDIVKSDGLSSASDIYVSETKTSKKGEGSETNEKHSTSSESTKDIKIYQSGGIIIMQNFNENTDLIEKKDFADGTKLIEQCSKLAEKVENSLHSSDESQRLLLNNSSGEVKAQSGKFVQFDLSSCDNTRPKSYDSSSEMPKSDCIRTSKNESYNGIISSSKIKDNSLPVPQNQDFTSLSTQENDSVISNLLGMSPTSSISGKKLEWDSGADVGYLNLDLTKENISTIERIILKGLSDDGVSKKQVIYQKTEQQPGIRPPKVVLERMPSELEIGEIIQNYSTKGNGYSNGSSSAGRTTKSNTWSSQSDNGVVSTSKKLQNMTDNIKTDETLKISLEGRNNKIKHHSKNSKSEENYKARKISKSGKLQIHSGASTTSAEEKFVETKKMEEFEETPTFSDKSTYVNTLYGDPCFELLLGNISRSEESGRSNSSDNSKPYPGELPIVKNCKKKNNKEVQETSVTGRLKDKINTIIDASMQSKTYDDKKKSSNNGTIKSAEHFELRCKIDEFGLQYMKMAESKTVKSDPPLCSFHKSVNLNSKEKSVGSGLISAASTSVRTVKSNEKTPKKSMHVSNNVKNFSDQIIQTSELLYESKGIQAFQSAKCSIESSEVEEISSRNNDEISGNISGVTELKDDSCTNLLLSRSKSIQAPGLNSSLPKHLAHPKKTDVVDKLNTKSTQFFGGPVTSLPNYHSNAAGKEAEKVKKSYSKIISEENSRITLENMKNASVKKNVDMVIRESVLNRKSKLRAEDIGDPNHKKSDKETKKNKNDHEMTMKENFSVNDEKLTDDSKRPSELPKKESEDSYNLVSGSKKSDSVIFGSCEVQLSDDGKNIFLTSDLLKEHGDSIDRNIIQEKYFQSQLLELGRRPMISRSTSMEKKTEFERNTQTSFSLKTGVSVSCQYSSVAASESGEMIQYSGIMTESRREETQPKDARHANECGSNCIIKKENKCKTLGSSVEDKNFALADSLSNSTQTDHSWNLGLQQMGENQDFAVDRTLSFEYLPGHIYENAENLNGKSLSTTNQSVDIANSAESGTDSTPELNIQVKESESGHTLVLENSYESPLGSDQMKNLDNNLTELEMVVTKLHEKEAIFQRITDSVLSTVSRANGSGDSTHPSAGESLSNHNSQATEQISFEIELAEESSKSYGSKPEANIKIVDTKEISAACQTDGIECDSNHFNEQKKKIEQKRNDEKEQQIKWIENEIQHLNMLRRLLEKQEESKNLTQRKKRHYYLTEAKGLAVETSSQDIVRNILRDSLPQTVPSIRGTAAEDELKLKTLPPSKLTENSAEFSQGLSDAAKSCAQIGMALPLTNNVQEITMLPVGVQVTLRNRKPGQRNEPPLEKKIDSIDLEDKSSQTVASLDFMRQNDIGIQHPSLNNRLSGTHLSSGSSDSRRRCRCFKCNKIKCACLKSQSMDGRKSSQNEVQEKKYEQDSTKPVGASSTITSDEFSKSDVKIPEIRDIDNSRGVSTIGTSTPHVSRSRESSKQERYYVSSEGSVPFEKCVCLCHDEPLPRCMSCNLLNTCKKCQCYKKIKCCVCKITASKGSLQRKCATVSSSCLCNDDFCQMCRCSRVKNQICLLCPCHAKLSLEATCKFIRKYEERSCQTEGKECNCCTCNEKSSEDLGCYRKTKYMSEEQHVAENREPSEMVCPSEQKYETEARKPVEEKFSFQMKVPLEKKNCAELKNATQMKNEVEKRCACEMQPVGVKELKEKFHCRCQSRNALRKSTEEHPRHYFLQVEETTEEESSDSDDRRNSLEVITIKVPIRNRKVCKGNRNSNSSPQRNLRKLIPNKERSEVFAGESRYLEQNSETPNECKCCEDCVGHSHKRFAERFRTTNDIYCAQGVQYGDRKNQQRTVEPLRCKCCEDCPGHQNLKPKEKKHEYAKCDDYERKKFNSISYSKAEADVMKENTCDCENCVGEANYKSFKYSPNGYHCQEDGSELSGECQCCDDCPGTIHEEVKYQMPKPRMTSARTDTYEEEESDQPSEVTELSSGTGKRRISKDPMEAKKDISHNPKSKTEKYKKSSPPGRKNPLSKPYRPQRNSKSKGCKGSPVADRNKNKDSDYYNFNKKEFLTKSELEREEKKKKPARLTLQECLTIKRPDLYTRAECRRKIISEKSRDRAERHNKRIECLSKFLPQCDNPGKNADLKLFTSTQMRKQTKKFYKKLPEVTNKIAEEKKKMQFRTNKLMAEIFAKKLQLQTLKGCLNLSNSFTVMSTI